MPDSHRLIEISVFGSNYMQVMEGGLDSSHLGILHAIWAAETRGAREDWYRELVMATLPAGHRQPLRGRLAPAWMWWPDEGCHTGTPSLPTAGFLPASAFHVTLQRFVGFTDDRTDDCAFGADDIACVDSCSKNYVSR